MHHALLAGATLLFIAPASTISFDQEFTFSDRTNGFGDTIPSTTSVSSASSSQDPDILSDYFLGVIGPLKPYADNVASLRFFPSVSATYKFDYEVQVMIGPGSDLSYADSFLLKGYEANLTGRRLMALPNLTIPKSLVNPGSFLFIRLHYAYNGIARSVSRKIWVDKPQDFLAPANGADIIDYEHVVYFDERREESVPHVKLSGFASEFSALSFNKLPLDKLVLHREGLRRHLGFADCGGTLTLLSHVDDFLTGTALTTDSGSTRSWDLLSVRLDTDTLALKTASSRLYDPATGLMREGDVARGAEFLSSDFFLPPCKKEEVGSKAYDFLLCLYAVGENAKITIKYSFKAYPQTVPVGGCEGHDYCVGVAE